jgi:hypothetical protein
MLLIGESLALRHIWLPHSEAPRLVASVRETVSLLEAQPWRSWLVVVDNGGADETAAVARAVTSEQVKLAVIGCAWRGKGAAVRRGLLAGSRRSSVSSTPTTRRRYPRSFEPWRSAGWRGGGHCVAARARWLIYAATTARTARRRISISRAGAAVGSDNPRHPVRVQVVPT